MDVTATRHHCGVLARVSFAIAWLAAAVIVSAAAAAPRTPQAATFVLRRGDLGPAYTGRGAPVGNADAARSPSRFRGEARTLEKGRRL